MLVELARNSATLAKHQPSATRRSEGRAECWGRSVDAGLSVPKLGIDTNVSTTNSLERDVTYKWLLPGGNAYQLAVYSNSPAPYLWTVDA
jgi:hypothetical protein